MRLHRLRVQAFGPFAGVEEVDVDLLAEQGLFLLHGPTGAGKTSVLDALCFALYGRAPGARSGGRLRSDHAPAGATPEVLCEFSAGDRRFEVTRSPAWARPKKRGEGTTTEQARTLLREKVDGEWVPRSSRNDEASQLLADVLGMGMEQFTKVVLLPQGEFAAFLRAPADERRALLQRLFGTDRFADVEVWLGQARRTTGHELDRAEVGLDRLMARVDDAATVLGTPRGADDGSLPSDGASRPETQDPVTRVRAVASAARAALASCQVEHATAAGGLERAREQLARASQAHERATTLSRVLAEKARIEAENGSVDLASTALSRAAAAAAVTGHVAAAASALTRVQTCVGALSATEQQARHLVEPLPDGANLARDVRVTLELVGRLEELVDAEQDAERKSARAATLSGRVCVLTAERDRLEEAVQELLRRRAAAAAQVERLTGPADTVAVLEPELARARQVLAAAVDAARLDLAVDGLRSRALTSGTAAHDARQRWLDLRELRLAGMAAELAASLEPGAECPVCGAVEHPGVATAAPAAVSADDETVARNASDDAQEVVRRVGAELAAAREECAGATSRSGGVPVDRSAAAVADLEQRLRDACAARDALAAVTSSIVDVDAQITRTRAVSGLCAERLAAAQVEAESAESLGRTLQERLARARGGEPSVAARRECLARRAAALEAVVAARAELEAARAAHAEVASEATAAVVAAGFVDVADAAASSLPQEARDQLRSRVTQHGEDLAAVRSRLAEPDLVAALQAVDADRSTTLTVDEAERRLATAATAERRCLEQLALVRRAVTSLDDLVDHVAADVAASAPLRARHELVFDLAACAEGNGGGNSLRMRLSAFVLAARLEQVAAAATSRLDTMSSGRFALVHTDALERAGARSGLGLQVVDAWTGAQRDTATLSGGEAFMASLSLALGLADVVQAESGGSAIETLFVDEGFGSLDEDTLDEVMATLDTLREGGRAVGLVSHVAELRARIPSRLEVVKTRTGSHLRLRAGAA